jgi:hypothetical protein
VAQAPSEAELPDAGKWSVTVPAHALAGLNELFLEIRYKGDVARLTSANRLLTDNFYNSQTWSVGLRRFLNLAQENKLELSVLPLRKDAPVYFELPQAISFSPKGQIDQLEGLRLIPEYELTIGTNGR